MDPNTQEILANLRGLHKQATVERSHFYVGKYAVIDIRTRQVRYVGSLDGARQCD